MRITFLVFALDSLAGTERTIVTQANALTRAGHRVRLVSVVRTAERPAYTLLPGVTVAYLVDLRDPERPRPQLPRPVRSGLVTGTSYADLHRGESLLIPRRWDRQYSSLTDVAMEAALSRIDADVLVTVTPALLAAAVQLVPGRTVVVHQEHRASSSRVDGLEALLSMAPRADLVALLSTRNAEWLRARLGDVAPPTVVMPNPLPLELRPRSTLRNPVIVAAGRLEAEKQFPLLVDAFALVADRIPDWRLRIFGEGAERMSVVQSVRKHGLYDRVELAGRSLDMPSEWGRAGFMALASRTEGVPLVIQEAMAAGVPAVAFDVPAGVHELIRHDVDGLLVSPDSVAGLAAAMLRLATDEALRDRLGESALAGSQRWAPERIAAQWVEHFAALVGATGHGRLARRADSLRVERAADEESVPPTVETALTPAEARSRSLRWVVDAVSRVASRWYVVPPRGERGAVVVVPMPDRDGVLAELARDPPSGWGLADTAGGMWPRRWGWPDDLAADLRRGRSSRVTAGPWPTDDGPWVGTPTGTPTLLGQGCSVDAEFWEVSVDGDLVAPDPTSYASEVPGDFVTVRTRVHGVDVPTLRLLAEPALGEHRFPVDVVYTWVDGTDPSWQAARDARLAAVPAELQAALGRKESSGRSRFVAGHDELRYSLRSVHLFAPWVRRIHLVTAGQRPQWLVGHPQVTVVDHAEILPGSALPTFNSHAIETALHAIPDLAEHWVYLNDDMFLGRPLQPHHFFGVAGQPVVHFVDELLGLDEDADVPPYLGAGRHNRRLLAEAFGVQISHVVAHTPYAHRTSVVREVVGRFADAVERTAGTPFRGPEDVSLLSSLAQHYGLLTGAAVRGEPRFRFVDLADRDVGHQLSLLLQRDRDFFCLGESHRHAIEPAHLRERVAGFLEAYFPLAAPWEADR